MAIDDDDQHDQHLVTELAGKTLELLVKTIDKLPLRGDTNDFRLALVIGHKQSESVATLAVHPKTEDDEASARQASARQATTFLLLAAIHPLLKDDPDFHIKIGTLTDLLQSTDS